LVNIKLLKQQKAHRLKKKIQFHSKKLLKNMKFIKNKKIKKLIIKYCNSKVLKRLILLQTQNMQLYIDTVHA